MNTHTKRIAASALVALLALSLSPTPIAPVAAEEEPPVKCVGYYKMPGGGNEVPIPGTGVGIPFTHPCQGFNDAVRPTGKLWAGLQLDENEDGMGDDWQAANGALDLVAGMDSDGDGLTNIQEFYWLSNPLIVDSDIGGGDGWTDGDEAKYWSSTNKGGTLNVGGTNYAYPGPFAFYDTDGDGIPNILDPDSDNDGLSDGTEVHDHDTMPGRADTDGDGLIDGGITPLGGQRIIGEVYDVGSDPTKPDSDSDGLTDRDEYEHWTRVRGYSGTKSLDTDGDGFINIRDSDSDGDGALDGTEVQYNTRADRPDTDGDKLPDGWEIRYNQNPLSSDASRDLDADGATSLEEYCYGLTLTTCRAWDYFANQDYYRGGTIPNDADTDDDLVLDGEEMDEGTNPHHWDTDLDGMPDEFELQYGLNPLDATDAALDADADFFDQDQDGVPEQVHSNLQEYQYGRPAGYDEAESGPWQLGTNPLDADTDDDGNRDAQEVYFGTDPRIPADLASDDDQDGLNWTEEANLGTDPNDPDTDGDGLCDGGRALACTFPGLSGVGHPGEADYGSTPWSTDSDGDGIPDGVEATIWDPEASGADADLDGDLLGGVIDADNDGDGLLDGEEAGHGADMKVPDSDGDGLTDGNEVHIYATRADDEDTDGDDLLDGAEIQVHHTDALNEDTDGDGLTDGAEVSVHGTDPVLWDTDLDGMPDGWEVDKGTQPRAADADLDGDNDGLTNGYEYEIGSHPMDADSDGDGLPDGWEDQHETGIMAASASGDPDFDGATNLEEYNAGTNPQDPDSDGDALMDGDELDEGTDPLATDSDLDGLTDGAEVHVHATNPLARDSDGDQLDDFDEVKAGTDPWDEDSDNDDLSDYQEIFVHQGKYDPNNPDTNGDGYTDSQNVALEGCPTCDDDNDGLDNEQEVVDYDTNPFNADTDCDGIEDGPEVTYWSGQKYSLSAFKAYLRNADVDGDGIKDGIEIGATGTGSQVLYRTAPDDADTDDDSLGDGIEARNNFKADCVQSTSASSMWASSDLGDFGLESLLVPPPGTEGNPIVGHAGSPLPKPVPGTDLTLAATDAELLAGLAPGRLYEDPSSGLLYGVDSSGLYVQGGYGVRLYVDLDALPDPDDVGVDLSDVLEAQAMGHESGVPCTNPLLPDTDGDGLTDSEEQSGSRNPYTEQRHDPNGAGGNTDPCAGDSDGDGINDGLEVGVRRGGGSLPGAWVMNPNRQDTDLDGKPDGVEDANQNGVSDDLSYDSLSGTYTAKQGSAGASSPVDADTDDDGLPDGVIGSLRDPDPLNWDLDGDGLSDGLEMGVTKPLVVDGITYTVTGKNVLGLNWPTFQEFKGDFNGPASCTESSASCIPVTTDVNLRDSDGDGIIDGLEDVNHNGKFGDFNSVLGQVELGPKVADTDNDGIVDGKELLIYGVYNFQSFVEARGDPWTGVAYDGHAFKTDPLKPSTDGDDILDGKDINPKGDALLLLQLDTFYQYDKIDFWGPDYGTDLVLKITMETGVGDFWLQTTKLQDFGSQGGSAFSGSGIDVQERKNPPSVTGATLAFIDILEEADDTIQFDLPDNIDDFAKARDLKVHVRLDAIDIDGTANDNDPVDVSPIKGATQYYDAKGVDLSAGPLAGGHQVPLDANGNGDSVKGDQNDGRLKMNVMSNLTPYFLRNLLGTQVLDGNCLGGVTETSGPCLQ